MAGENKINWYYKMWFKIISFLFQLMLLLVFFCIKYKFFWISLRIKIIEFSADKLNDHIDWLQTKNFWNGAQEIHSRIFIEYISKCIINKEWHRGNYDDENERLKSYFNYILNEYKNMLLMHKHEFNSIVIIEKFIK